MYKTNVTTYIHGLLREIEGPELRPELEETPNRVYRALGELLDGYNTNILELFTSFNDEESIPPQDNHIGLHDQIVAVKNIEAWSLCEHHLLPFHINASVAYLPKDKIIGASKIPRLVLAYAHRLQIQERITRQVANSIMNNLEPYGVAVIITGEHSCMRIRGVKAESSQLVTSVMLGTFRDNQSTRLEVLSLLEL